MAPQKTGRTVEIFQPSEAHASLLPQALGGKVVVVEARKLNV